jgi:hypothetical protein
MICLPCVPFLGLFFPVRLMGGRRVFAHRRHDRVFRPAWVGGEPHPLANWFRWYGFAVSTGGGGRVVGQAAAGKTAGLASLVSRVYRHCSSLGEIWLALFG